MQILPPTLKQNWQYPFTYVGEYVIRQAIFIIVNETLRSQSRKFCQRKYAILSFIVMYVFFLARTKLLHSLFLKKSPILLPHKWLKLQEIVICNNVITSTPRLKCSFGKKTLLPKRLKSLLLLVTKFSISPHFRHDDSWVDMKRRNRSSFSSKISMYNLPTHKTLLPVGSLNEANFLLPVPIWKKQGLLWHLGR
jgi:hypothetical protein